MDPLTALRNVLDLMAAEPTPEGAIYAQMADQHLAAEDRERLRKVATMWRRSSADKRVAPVGNGPVSRTIAATQAAIDGALGVAEALETPEALAERLGLTQDDQGDYWHGEHLAVWFGGRRWWTAAPSDRTSHPDALTALRAYAAGGGSDEH